MNKITSINGTLLASLNELKEHTENGTVHVMEDERTAWNTQATVKAKGILIATQEDLDEHTGNKAIHVEEEERTAWNAKADASALSTKTDTSVFDAHKNDAAVHITGKERETWNGKQDKLMDEAGNMTLAGGLTTAAAINANGGVNIPLASSPDTPTSGVNRLCSLGMAAVTDAFSLQSFLSSFTLYGDPVVVEQMVPGLCWWLRKSDAANSTVQIDLSNPLLGVSNYSGWRGFVLPVALGNFGSTSARKLTFSVGTSGNVIKKTVADLDMFTLSPAAGHSGSFVRFIDVTVYMVSDSTTTPAGYPVRVRELMYNKTEAKWVVYETNSVISSFNTNPAAIVFLAYQQADTSSSNPAGLWIGVNGFMGQRLLRIADLHAVTDTFNWMGVGTLYWDCEGGYVRSHIGAMRQMMAPGENQQNGAYYAFTSLETRQIQSTSTYDFTPYE